MLADDWHHLSNDGANLKSIVRLPYLTGWAQADATYGISPRGADIAAPEPGSAILEDKYRD